MSLTLALMIMYPADPAWLQEFYSAVANSEMVMPMILCPGQGTPLPMATAVHTRDTGAAFFNPRLNEYVSTFPGIDGYIHCLVYSSQDIYNSVKQILHTKYEKLGLIVDPLVQNGRQIINICCKRKQCAIINLFTAGVPQYQLSFEQMQIIRQKPIIVKPKAVLAMPTAPEKEALPEVSHGDAPTLPKQNHALEEMEIGIQQLQTHLGDAIKEKSEMEARLKAMRNEYEKRVSELESSLNAVQDSSVPVTVWEAVENVARRFASRLIIHTRVKDIVEAWPYQKKPRCVTHTVKMLEAVARTLYHMKFESPDGYIDPLQFQGITGYELGMTEGKMTKRNQELDALRYCRYEDRTVPIYAHLKKRIDKNLHMRIYIGFLEEERKILIGQVGPHMPNSQTA